jgi:hypothetical protein
MFQCAAGISRSLQPKIPENGKFQRFTMRILVDFGCDLMENHENLGIRQFLGYVDVYCL